MSQDLLKTSAVDGGGKSEGETRRWREAGNKLFTAGRDMEAVTRSVSSRAPRRRPRGAWLVRRGAVDMTSVAELYQRQAGLR